MAESSLRRRSVEPEAYRDNVEMKGSFKVSETTDGRGHIDTDPPEYGKPADGWGDTSNDVRDMLRLGKKQEFKRNFSLISVRMTVGVNLG